jgi:hypothetical protein
VTVSELINHLSSYPADARVTLLDAERQWLLPIEIKPMKAEQSNCGVDLVAIMAPDTDEIEGLVVRR